MIPENPKKPKKTPKSELKTLVTTPTSFAETYATHNWTQNYRGYPLMTSIILGKRPLLLRGGKNSKKPSIDIMKTISILALRLPRDVWHIAPCRIIKAIH